MTRLPDWRARLAAHVEAHRRAPFAFGRHDCGLFAAGAVEAICGTDPAAGLRGRYSTMAGALKHLRKAGHADHVALAASLFEEIHPSRASMGDLAAVETGEGPALAVCNGSTLFVAGDDGLRVVDLMSASRAFRVG